MKTPGTVDISGFNRGMAAFVDRLGIEAPKVLKKECGELLKTLIKVTPPREPARTRERIEKDVRGKFFGLDISTEKGHGMGSSQILWYRSSPTYLYGVAADKDMTRASVEELRQLNYRVRRRGGALRQILPFRHAHRRQQVALLQNIFTRKKTVTTLVTRLKAHVGRLKAGWLASWDTLAPGGGNRPPQWVMRHKAGARGYYLNGLGVKGHPTFTIANTAQGVGNPKLRLDGLVRSALGIRTKAMQTNLFLFMRGKKNLADYAK